MLLELKQICINYANFPAVLDRIDLGIRENEFIGITGKSGSGKTTLLETLSGLHKPDSGQVLFEGKDIWSQGFDLTAFRRKLQIVFQFPENQFFEARIWDEAAFGPKMLKLKPDEIDLHVRKALSSVGISDEKDMDRSPFILSGGMKRRLALACALAVSPGILLLDEPFSGLDAEGTQMVCDTLLDLHRKGMTIVMVSHEPDILCELADRLIVLSKGRIVMDGSPSEIYSETEKCQRYDIGQPDIKKIADLAGIDLESQINYTNFLGLLKSRLAGEDA